MLLNKESLKLMFESAVNSAIQAGAKVMEVYQSDDYRVEAKSDLSPLTLADTTSHEEIKKGLSVTRIPVISEEGRSVDYCERISWDLFWLVDPLDATGEFINRTGDFTVNIALIDSGYPVLGVVYAPAYKQLYFAAVNFGSFCKENIEPNSDSKLLFEDIIEGASRLPLSKNDEKFVVLTSRIHFTPETSDYIDSLRKQHSDLEVRYRGSSLKMCELAAGKADLYPRMSFTWEWDTAAGQIVAEEAGCTVCSIDDGERLHYNKENVQNPWFVAKRK